MMKLLWKKEKKTNDGMPENGFKGHYTDAILRLSNWFKKSKKKWS